MEYRLTCMLVGFKSFFDQVKLDILTTLFLLNFSSILLNIIHMKVLNF